MYRGGQMGIAHLIVRVITAAWLTAVTGTTAAADSLDGIVNYREYSERLSSSGQPTASQFPAVGEAGFERVVFLAFTDHEESVPHEDRIVSELGIDYVQIPVDWEAPSISDSNTSAWSSFRPPAGGKML